MQWALNWLRRNNLLNVRTKEDLVKRKKPLAYIVGNHPFINSKIYLRKPLLIPRVETEFWVSNLIQDLKKTNGKKLCILDLCSGTGCIGIAIAMELKEVTIHALDNSRLAVKMARFNAKRNNVQNSVTVSFADLFNDSWLEELKGQVDLIVSNPPYIPAGSKLPLSVKLWEDPKALFGGADGIDFHKRIINNIAPIVLKPSCLDNNVYLEIDPRNFKHLKGLFNDAVFERDQFKRLRVLKLKL
jgi:HemK-like putative methylase